MSVRRLTPDDADQYVAIRGEMLIDAPASFLASPGDDRAGDPDEVRRLLSLGDENVIFGAFEPKDLLVGAVGIVRQSRPKIRHKAVIWGVYVRPSARGRGHARSMMEAALAHAHALPGVEHVFLSVSESAPEARALYESLGFETWGTEPDALRIDGVSYAERHMWVRLPLAAV